MATTSKVTKKTAGAAAPAEDTKGKNAEAAPAEPEKQEKPVVKKVDLNEIVTVRNGFQGRLIYISKKTGEEFVWENFGDEQDMEIGELRNARSSAKAFFENNWFMLDEQWIVDYLGVSRFYRHALKIEDFDPLFKKTPEEVSSTIAEMTDGQKRSLAFRARQLIADGEIDSNKVISALEGSLGIELVER